MRSVSTLSHLPEGNHLAALIFPVRPTGKVEYVTFKDKKELETWASTELAKKNDQRSFRILDSEPKTLQVRVNGAVLATLA